MFVEVTDIDGVLNMVNVENIKVLVKSDSCVGKGIKSTIWFSDTYCLDVQDEYEFLLDKIEKVLSI